MAQEENCMDVEGLRAIARERVLPTIEERSGSGGFDRSLWKEMAGLGLMGAMIDEEWGGGGESAASFVAGASVLAAEGCDLGLVLSLVDHAILSAYPLQRFGSADLKTLFLPSLCNGDRIGAAAISEPGSGGAPSRMRSRARKENGYYVLEGTKEPITNGPVADLFTVIAYTDPEAGKDGLSAFLVEKGAGLRTEELALDFLPTAPHGRVVLEGARVPAGNLLGEEGWGHRRISHSIFVWERAAIIPVIVAFLERLHHLVVSELEATEIPPDLRMVLARRKVEATAYRVVGERLVELAFGPTRGRDLMELLLFFGKALPAWVESMRGVAAEAELAGERTIARMLADLRLLEVGSSLLDWQFQRIL
jgi:alkylation response protein AidB-like acyl-CoA dehydrogenase